PGWTSAGSFVRRGILGMGFNEGFNCPSIPQFPITQFPITQLPDYPITRLPNYPITQLPDYPITRLPNYQITQVPDSQTYSGTLSQRCVRRASLSRGGRRSPSLTRRFRSA